jgi:transposase-like protein
MIQGIPRQEYNVEHKGEAVKRVKDGKSAGLAATEMGLIEQTLGNWVKAFDAGTLSGVGAPNVTRHSMESSRPRVENARPKQQPARARPDMVKRCCSRVKGRNGQLSLHHHGRHCLSDCELLALTAVHNLHIIRALATAPAERSCGRASEALFEQLILRMPFPP